MQQLYFFPLWCFNFVVYLRVLCGPSGCDILNYTYTFTPSSRRHPKAVNIAFRLIVLSYFDCAQHTRCTVLLCVNSEQWRANKIGFWLYMDFILFFRQGFCYRTNKTVQYTATRLQRICFGSNPIRFASQIFWISIIVLFNNKFFPFQLAHLMRSGMVVISY